MKVDESPFDLDYMVGLVEDIARFQEDLAKAKLALDMYKAEIARHVTKHENYWINGKPPSMSYISSDYQVLGYDDESRKELQNLENAVIELDAEFTRARTRFTVEREKLDVWRTASANARNTLNFVGND